MFDYMAYYACFLALCQLYAIIPGHKDKEGEKGGGVRKGRPGETTGRCRYGTLRRYCAAVGSLLASDSQRDSFDVYKRGRMA